MSTIANTNVVSFPKPSLSAIHEAIANWEGRSGLNYPDSHRFLLDMARTLAQKWNDDKDATPESREESKQAIMKALSRRAKEILVTVPAATIFESALADLRTATPAHNSDSQTLNSARASSFEMKAVKWLWPGRYALGKLGLLVGLPDEGKGQVFCDMAARVTQGWDWPCGEGKAPKGNVVLLTAEDDINDTIVPRLVAAGADLDRIEVVKMVRGSEKERMFSLVTDLDLLREKIEQVGDVKLVQIDPITAYLGNGKVDSFRTTDVRSVLPLSSLLRTCASLSSASCISTKRPT
jgi:hypothetical protein